MYPIKFRKIYKEKVWGGHYFSELFSGELSGSKRYGESWEVSTHKNGMSVIANGMYEGMTLQELIAAEPEKVLGKSLCDAYGPTFPLLIKYLDINDKLSIQVHPDNDYALKEEGQLGKFESWYIISASKDARIILGTASGITKEQFEEKVKSGDFSDVFNVISVKAGDFIDIKPGTVHGTLEGNVVVCEIQQSSDVTYRLYDFDRTYNGVKRPLHIDKSLSVISYDGSTPVLSLEDRCKTGDAHETVQRLTANPYYSIEQLEVQGAYNDRIHENFKVYSVLKGEGMIIHGTEEYPVQMGESCFIPARLNVSLKGQLSIVKSFM